jgi:spore germination protein KB
VLDNGRISSVQLLLLLFILEASTGILYAPAKMAELAGRDSWLAASVVPTLYALLVVGVVIALARRFPFKVLTEYLPEVVGKIPGKLLAAAYAAFFIHITSVVLNEGSSFIHIAFLPETPVTVLDIVWAGVAIYGAYLGIECIARQNELVWPALAVSFFLTLILAARNLNIGNLKPVLENGLLPVIRGGILLAPWRGYVFLILMLFPYLNQKQEALKTTLLHLVLISLTAFCGMFVIIGVFGDLVTAHLVFPYFELVRYISLAHIIERLEILVVIIWVASVVVKLAVFYHSAGIATASTLGLKNYRTTLLPIAIITVILSRVLYGNYLKLDTFLFKTYPIYAPVVELAVPALILLIAVIRKKSGSEASGYTLGGTESTPAPKGGGPVADR